MFSSLKVKQKNVFDLWRIIHFIILVSYLQFLFSLFFLYFFDFNFDFSVFNYVNFRLNQSTKWTAVPSRIFESLKRSNVVKFMKACKEVNIAFIPYEQQVTIFSLLFFWFLFNFLFSFVWFLVCVYFRIFVLICNFVRDPLTYFSSLNKLIRCQSLNIQTLHFNWLVHSLFI